MMERHKRKLGFYIATLWIIFFTLPAGDLWAQTDSNPGGKNRYGLSSIIGSTYSPQNDITFVLLNGFVLFDHTKLWARMPEWLRLKAEGNLGSTLTPYRRLTGSANLMVLFYLADSSAKTFRPYVEGGIGAIYTDFQVKGEGSRINFDPFFSVGTEFKTASGAGYLIAFRIQHLSNGSLNHENVGVDSLSLVLGKFF